MAAQNGYLYAVSSAEKFLVFSLADRKTPTPIGSCDTSGPTLGLAVYGNRAYLADGTRLRIIDITNQGGPVTIGYSQSTFAGNANDVAADANYVYMANGYDGFLIISTASPYATVGKIDHTDTAMQGCHRVAVSGDHAYVIAGQGNLYAISISTPSAPLKKDSVDFPGYGGAEGIAVLGSQVWVADNQTESIRIVDVTDENNLVEIGSRLHNGRPQAVAISGSYACVAGTGFGLDISDPALPSVVDAIAVTEGIKEVAVTGDYVYVASHDWSSHAFTLRTVDQYDPFYQVVHTGSSSIYNVYGFTISGDYAYVTTNEGGSAYHLKVIDLQDTSFPVVGWVDTGGSAADIAVSGVYAFLAKGSSGVQIINVSDSANPFIVKNVPVGGSVSAVEASGRYLYALVDGNLAAIDLFAE